ncbi:MAG: lamin tail domain-containing protein, partial [Flavobacteriales bacterium]|nr:lamin tail domain-containing protein [Flavobacteriales bacterium]
MSCSKYAAALRLFSHTIFACAFLSFLTTAVTAQGPGPNADLLFTTQHPDPDSGDAFGQSFDSTTDGDEILVVGTPMDAVDGNDAEGSVQVYEDGDHTASLTAPDGQAYSKFGSSVSINDAGDLIAVGAPGPSDGENGGVDFAGKIYLYHNAYDGTGWNFLTVISGTDDEGYGSTLAQLGDWIAVGAPSASNTHNNQGAVHMILKDGDCIYNSDHTVYANDPQDDASFGSALSFSESEWDETLLIGDPGNDELGADAGAVYDAYLDGGEFTIYMKYTADAAAAGAEFGASVSTVQDYYWFAVGAPGDAGGGAAYDVELAGDYQNKIQPCDLEAGDRFGASVSYSYDYSETGEDVYIMAVGAPMADRIWTEGAVAQERLDAGKVYLFNWPEELEEWNLTAIVSRGASAEAGDHFGHAVQLEGVECLMISAPEEDDQGLLYTYELIDGTPPAVDVLDIPDYTTCEDGGMTSYTDGDDYVLDLQDYITNTSNDALEFSINETFIQSTELSVSNEGSVVTVDFSPVGAFEQDILVDVHNIMTCEDLTITFHVTEVPNIAGFDVETSETSNLLAADGAIEVTTFGYGTEIELWYYSDVYGSWAASGVDDSQPSIEVVANDSAVFSGLLAGEYTIGVTFENGCSNMTEVLIVPAPPVWDQDMPADMTVDCHDVPLPIDATASDPCDSETTVTFEESETPGDCPQERVLTRVWTATDCEGNSTEHVQVLTVVDTLAPSFVETLPADMEAPCDAIPAAETLTATDLCDPSPTMSFAEEILGDCPSTYIVRRTWHAVDACGNVATHVQDIQLVDDVPPAFVETLPADFDISCDATLPEPDVLTATDQCDNAPQVAMVEVTSDDACANDRTVTRTWTASDCAGNTTVHIQVISLYDDIAPEMIGDEIAFLSCDEWPADPTFENLQAAGIIDASDNCSLDHVDIEFTEMSGGCNPDHILLYTPYDACGNQGDSHYQIVQIDDDEAPVFTSVPAAITLDCTDDIEAYLEMATAVDNCDDAVNMTYIDEITPTDCPEEYSITRLFRAEDCGYNSSIATQIITVDDSTDPSLTLTAPDDKQFSGCYASADMSEETHGSVSWVTADDCGDVSVSYTVSDDATFDCDYGSEGSHTVVRTFTVTAMDCAGNSTTASTTQTITITDDEDPTVLFDCPIPVTVYLDENCDSDAVAENSLGDGSGMAAVANDNCDSDVYLTTDIISESDTYLGAVDGVGSYETARTYEITAYDNCGNSTTATCTQTISVLDTISPEVDLTHGADIDLYVDENGDVDTSPYGDALGASMSATDNCSGSITDEFGLQPQLVGGIIITEIADPNSDYKGRFVEIHNSSDADQDMTGWILQRWTNDNAGPSSNTVDLTVLGTLAAGDFALISSRTAFTGYYGFDADIVAGTGGPADSNGDDQIAIVDAGSNIIDMFGVAGEDGSNTCHEFEDGRAERAASNVTPNGGAWDEAGWNVWSDYSLSSGCTNHSSSYTQETEDMDPGSWIGVASTVAL